ncbi:MAG: hypothetical protein GKS07_09000 [Nitrosopumilus sp.]|nr:MAG: hypothetical protein GKS07_09000 [Nitrosopumilus sp.]
MGNSRGVRLPDSNDKKIDEIKDQMGLSFSALISHITDDWLHSRRSKQQRGDITFAAEIIKNFLKHISEADIRKNARANAKYIVDEMRFQANTLDYEEMSRRIMEWNNKENGIEMVRKSRKGLSVFMQKHHMGQNWSMHQCVMYARMFEIIGETVIPDSIKYDGSRFSFEVIRND